MATFFGAFAGAIVISLLGRMLKGRALMGLSLICAVIVFAIFGTVSTSPEMEVVWAKHQAGPIGESGLRWLFGAMTTAATVVIASPFILLAERR